jgi:hypothetical protein
MESKGVVRRVIEKDGTLLVSFPRHDGYFRVPDNVKERILKAHQDQEEISFTFDGDLNILEVSSESR